MKKQDFEDDGRTVADMSGVSRPSYASSWIGEKAASELSAAGEKRRARNTADLIEMDDRERRAAVFGALGAALLIGLIFIAAAGILIAALLFFWKAW